MKIKNIQHTTKIFYIKSFALSGISGLIVRKVYYSKRPLRPPDCLPSLLYRIGWLNQFNSVVGSCCVPRCPRMSPDVFPFLCQWRWSWLEVGGRLGGQTEVPLSLTTVRCGLRRGEESGLRTGQLS